MREILIRRLIIRRVGYIAVSDVDEVSAYGKANLIAEKMYQWKYHLAGCMNRHLACGRVEF